MKHPQRRHIVLAIALACSVLASVMAYRDEEIATEVVSARQEEERGAMSTSPSSSEPGLLGKLQRTEVAVSEIDPFRAKSWYVAPPAPPPAPPPKPTAPPLPFKYMGMFEENGKATVYLVRGDESFAVATGEKFADSYQLEKIERGMLVINYLPLSIRQTLAIGISE